jgi:hypothetical protein
MKNHPVAIATMLLLFASASRAPAAANTARPATTQAKPWVDDFPAFVNATAGKQDWIVGRSTMPCVTEDEAFQAATRDAGEQLLARLRPQLSPRSYEPDSEAWLQRRLARELVIGRLVSDRYVARVQRPFGELWSESVLVDASSSRVGAIARDYDAWMRGRSDTRRGAAASVVGLSLAILLIYAVVNAITRGYFRGRLRAGAGLSLAAAMFALYYYASRTGG